MAVKPIYTVFKTGEKTKSFPIKLKENNSVDALGTTITFKSYNYKGELLTNSVLEVAVDSPSEGAIATGADFTLWDLGTFTGPATADLSLLIYDETDLHYVKVVATATTTSPESSKENNVGEWEIFGYPFKYIGGEVVEIPTSAFADVYNPTSSEVETWVDANLTNKTNTLITYNPEPYAESPVGLTKYVEVDVTGQEYISSVTISGTQTNFLSTDYQVDTSANFDESAFETQLTGLVQALDPSATVTVEDEIDSDSRVVVTVTAREQITQLDIETFVTGPTLTTTSMGSFFTLYYNSTGYKSFTNSWLIKEDSGVLSYVDQGTNIVSRNKFYVSKSNGNNTTAERGDPTKPYADPYTAVRYASQGDTIEVLDGVWTVSLDSGDNADITLVAKEHSLARHNVNTYWHQDTGITVIDDTPNYLAIFFIPIPGDHTFKVVGKGVFKTLNDNYLMVFGNFYRGATRDIDVALEADYVHCSSYVLIGKGNSNIKFKGKVREVLLKPYQSGAGISFWYAGNSGDGPENLLTSPEVNIKIDTVRFDCVEFNSGGDQSAIVNIRDSIDGNYVVDIGKIVGVTSSNGFLYNLTGYGDYSDVENNSLMMTVGLIDVDDRGIFNGTYSAFTIDDTTDNNNSSGTASNVTPCWAMHYYQNISTGTGNNQVVLNVGEVRGNHPISMSNSEANNVFVSGSDRVVWNIGKAHNCRGNVGPNVILGNGIGALPLDFRLNIQDCYSESNNNIVFIDSVYSTWNMFIGGNYTVGSSAPNIQFMNDASNTGAIQLERAKLIQSDSADVAIATLGTNTKTIQAIEVHTNSTAADANISIQPIITVNINLK